MSAVTSFSAVAEIWCINSFLLLYSGKISTLHFFVRMRVSRRLKMVLFLVVV
jgi:hypothetical protein